MMVEAKSLTETIPQSLQGSTELLSKLIRELAGDHAKALALYGLALDDAFDSAKQPARSVLVVDKVDLELLREISRHGLRLGKAGLAAPVVMTAKYMDESRDTFPLELIEIQQLHVMLFGDDHFEKLEFEDRFVRLQCERDIKGIAIGLRQGLLASAGRDRLLGSLEIDIGPALVRTMRGMLWLKKQRAHRTTAEILGEIEKVLERRLTGVRTAMNISADHGWPEFQRLYDDVEALGETVNGW